MPLEELKALLRFRKITYRQLASHLNIGVSTLCLKINRKNRLEFTSSEIVNIARYLDFEPNDVVRYFFPELLA